jgi:drug/metabolite transporter, DME family
MTELTLDARVHARVAYRGGVAVLVAAALWGTVGPAQVLAGSRADPAALGVARLLVGGGALAFVGARAGAWRAALRRDVVRWVLLAAAATGVYQVTFMRAVDQLGAALATAIALGVAPIATGLCARWWAGERLTASWAAGTATAVAGCVALLGPGRAGGHVGAAAIGTALVSGTCYGVYTVAAKRFLRPGVPSLPVTAVTLVVAGVALSPLLALHPAHLADPRSLALVVWTGLAGTAVAYTAFVRGLGRTTAATAGTLSLTEPMLAVVLGVVLLGERLSASAAAGCVILLVGLVGVTVADSWPRATSAAGGAAPVGVAPLPVSDQWVDHEGLTGAARDQVREVRPCQQNRLRRTR